MSKQIKAQINTKIILRNLAKLKKSLKQTSPGKRIKICAVLKANAYSFGDVQIAKLIESRVDNFAVATLCEAERLRGNGISKQIILLGACPDFARLIALEVTPSINSAIELEQFTKTVSALGTSINKKYIFHIKVKTSLNRFGVSTIWELRKILSIAKKNRCLKLEGIYTHFAHEEDKPELVDKDIAAFTPFYKMAKRYFPSAYVHSACAGTAHYPPALFDMVRVGKLLYGGYKGYETAIDATCKVVATQNAKQGQEVGYGGTHAFGTHGKIAVIPCGYADIIPFAFGNKSVVMIKKVPCPIIGRVSMDSAIVDISHIKRSIKIGESVKIFANNSHLNIMKHCENSGIVTCDLLCSLNFTRTDLEYV